MTEDFLTVRRRAVYNFAQEVYPETAQIPAVMRDLMWPADLDSHSDHCRWQNAYREAEGRGKNADEARLAADTATGAPHTRMAVKGEGCHD
jgi:hypothetical protein